MTRDEVLREILAVIKDEARDLGHYGDRPSYAARIKQHADAALALLASVPEREPDGWMHGRTAAQWRRGEWGGTSFTRSPDGIVDPVPVYIGAAQAAESEGL
jgi:hypothetical protein